MSFTVSLCTPDLSNVHLPNHRPIRLLFLTSIRDTGECDRNGLVVGTGAGQRYMEGVIERTRREIQPGGKLFGYYQLVGVIVDDLPLNLKDYPVLPTSERPWLWPQELDIPTWNIPSHFRHQPKMAVAERMQLKLEFEQAVYDLFRSLEADVIVSDHYMARIEHLIDRHGLAGRVLNIHPAVTVRGHEFCFRGPTPTADAIARAQHDPATVTGATLHLVNDIIDDGPAVAYGVGTPVYPNDEPQWLRWRNYQTAKLPVFVAGMLHYRELVTR
ncbi:MAG: hypothetical protein HY565_04820 [Candidatus Kerfeldbacteria bacterium]|nr:hypothetical protein [Candidatus Kerfeldbacteria bacterium]